MLVDHAEDNLFQIQRELQDERHVPASMLAAVLADCKEEERMREVFTEHRPTLVFHAAAYKHVGLMESCLLYTSQSVGRARLHQRAGPLLWASIGESHCDPPEQQAGGDRGGSAEAALEELLECVSGDGRWYEGEHDQHRLAGVEITRRRDECLAKVHRT